MNTENKEFDKVLYSDPFIEVEWGVGGFRVIANERIIGQARYNLKDALERAYINVRGGDLELYSRFDLLHLSKIFASINTCAGREDIDNLRTKWLIGILEKWKMVCGSIDYQHRVQINTEFPEDMTKDRIYVRARQTIEINGDQIDKQITISKPVTEFDWFDIKPKLTSFYEDHTKF